MHLLIARPDALLQGATIACVEEPKALFLHEEVLYMDLYDNIKPGIVRR